LPLSYLMRTVRTMGVKVGLIGPARGTGSPRVLLETSLLAALVAALCPRDGLSLPEFVDAVYTHTGLIVGAPSGDWMAREALERAAVGIDDPDSLLATAQDRLADRLLRAGLARKF